MKSIWKTLGGLLMAAMVLHAEETVKPGTFPNLISNGKLELYDGTFPRSWRHVRTEPGYQSSGGFQDGGRFIFTGPKQSYLIRQDWTFNLIEGELYYLRAKFRTKNFKAGKAMITVFNNGWTESFSINFPNGTSEWKSMDKVFPGMASKSDYYSIAVLVDNVQSGELEVSDIAVEPATVRAKERSLEYRKLIPVPELVVLGRRNQLQAADAVLNCRWFGDKNLRQLSYSAGKISRQANIGENGLVKLDLNGLEPGKYTVKAQAGEKTLEVPVEIKPAFTPAEGKVLNNFHTVISEQQVKAGGSGTFVNPRIGWVLFVLPENMTIRIAGYKKAVKNGNIVFLPMGNHSFKAEKGSGSVRISAVAETSIYQLGAGPYLPVLPKHDWAFAKKYQTDIVMSFLGCGLKGADTTKFRAGHQKLYAHCAIGEIIKCKGDKYNHPGMNPKYHWWDGFFADELTLGTEKPIVLFIRNLDKVAIPAGRDVLTYITGHFPDTSYVAEVFSRCINLSDFSRVMLEVYLPSTYTDEARAEKQVKKLANIARNINEVCPDVNPYWGLSLCHSNVALSFTVDNEPEADHRVLLDMQMRAIATDPAFKGIGLINFWGDNYSDLERTRWVMDLMRHYVIEGKTSSLAAERGLKLCPGHLRNASFRDGLKEWQTEGSVSPGRSSDGGRFLRRFNEQKDPSVMVTLDRTDKSASVAQKIRNLVPGKDYKIRVVTSGSGRLALKLDGKALEPAIRLELPAIPKRRPIFSCYDEYVFTAGKDEVQLALDNEAMPKGTKTNLHYVSVMTCFKD